MEADKILPNTWTEPGKNQARSGLILEKNQQDFG